ncbi:hypothetical protein EDB81DRAFT_665774 [Dactylonectria macrodidyma]|uniref:BTB domain-containing protein n=1 Tax=Dactylonectria macrodidyma TaxID=307937 RepID=A0A9P9IJY8_9HYPO|nr:hypothetical protein EDB81DRAFT_665774 [Dactylonectria macrodidyma]
MTTQSIEFDPHGDVKLQVGPREDSGQIMFTVCSRTLARVSPVFERMLFGNFAESRPNTLNSKNEWIVKLPADKAGPLALFMYISHGHLHRIPKKLSIDKLYDLTTLTNYYDSTRILGPWVHSWMDFVEDDVRNSKASLSKALWVSWEFGHRELFERVAHKMLMESDGPIGANDPKFQDLGMPPQIIERIDDIRFTTIQSLLDVFQDMIENLIVVDEKPRWCRHAVWMGHHRCESMILGSMTFCLARANLWPLPHPEDVEISIIGLYRKTTSLIIHDIGKVGEKPLVDHHECNPGPYLLGQVNKIVNGMENPVTEVHRKLMEEQVRKLHQ